jgi:isocitrate dehydrogenase
MSTEKIVAPPMVYISGEEMTTYTMELIMEKWIQPYIDTSKWEYFDLSCVSRDDTEDQVLHDAVAAGSRIRSIFKEPTVTPTEVQKVKLGLKKAWGSPNGAMRRGWNGITISRDTIHIEGMQLGFKRPVFFERQAVGGEYSAGWKMVDGQGTLKTVFTPDNGADPILVRLRASRRKGLNRPPALVETSSGRPVVSSHTACTSWDTLPQYVLTRANPLMPSRAG